MKYNGYISVLSASRGGVRLSLLVVAVAAFAHFSTLCESRGCETSREVDNADSRKDFSTLCESRGCETRDGAGHSGRVAQFQYSLRVEGV